MDFEIISTPNAPNPMGPYSQATRAGGFIFCAGQGGVDPATGRLVEGGIKEQTRQVFRNLSAVLDAAGNRSKPRRKSDGIPARLEVLQRDE